MSHAIIDSASATSRRSGEILVVSGLPAKSILLISSFALAVVSLTMIIVPPEVSPNWPMAAAGGFFAWALLYLIGSYHYYRTVYLFTTAYMICLAIFHLGHIFAHITGLYDLQYLVTGDMAFWYQQAIWHVNLAFASLGLGVGLSLRTVRVIGDAGDLSTDVVSRNLTYAFGIGFLLMLAALAGMLLLGASVGNIMRFSRAEIFSGVGDTRGFGFFLILAPSAMVLLVTTARSSLQKRFAYGTCLVIALLILFFGYRSSVMFPGLIAAILWVKLGKRIPIPVVIVAVMIVLVAIPSVRYLRAQGAYESLSGNDVTAALAQAEDTKQILIELGGVSSVVAYVVKTVPEQWPYRLGQSYWLAFKDSIPNIGLHIAESKRADLLAGGVVDKAVLGAMHPADWYTYIVDRWLFNNGGGAGFSTIAEAYLNFGLAGILSYFGGLGFLLGRLDQVDLRTRPKLLVFSGAMLWPLMKTVRNSFGVFLKPVAFVLVSLLIWKVATFLIAKRNR